MLLHLADRQEQLAIDYREKAPQAADRDMFLDADGNAVAKRSQFTHLAAGVPGTVRGLALALEKYGTISLERAIAPASKLAEGGSPIGDDLYDSLNSYAPAFGASPEALKIFFQADQSPRPRGSLLVQKDLGTVLSVPVYRSVSV